MLNAAFASLPPYLRNDAAIDVTPDGIPRCRGVRDTPTLAANIAYFGNPVWAREYLGACHRTAAFRSR